MAKFLRWDNTRDRQQIFCVGETLNTIAVHIPNPSLCNTYEEKVTQGDEKRNSGRWDVIRHQSHVVLGKAG